MLMSLCKNDLKLIKKYTLILLEKHIISIPQKEKMSLSIKHWLFKVLLFGTKLSTISMLIYHYFALNTY